MNLPLSLRLPLLIAVCSVPLLAHADMLAVSFGGAVVDVDSATGSSVVLAASGPSFNSLAFGGGQYWSVSNVGAQLATIDPATGAATLGPVVTGTSSAVSIRGLAFAGGTLYGIQNTVAASAIAPDDLVRIDLTTGVATRIGATGLSGVQALASDSAGRLLAWDVTAGLVTLNAGTGLATDVNTLSDGLDIQALAFSPSGVLFGAASGLYTVDAVTGTTTFVTAINGLVGGNVRGLEFISSVPEPAAWLLFGVGAAGLALRRAANRVS